MTNAIVLAISDEHAAAILDGRRRTEIRRRPPACLPVIAHLAVTGTGMVVGECELGEPVRRGEAGVALTITKPRRYRTPRPVTEWGLARIPRSFRYVQQPRPRP